MIFFLFHYDIYPHLTSTCSSDKMCMYACVSAKPVSNQYAISANCYYQTAITAAAVRRAPNCSDYIPNIIATFLQQCRYVPPDICNCSYCTLTILHIISL